MKLTGLLLQLLVSILMIAGFSSCDNNQMPKPRGYFRIDLPERNYKQLDSIFPYSFEYPIYAVINNDPHAPDQPYWINVDFPRFKASVHISYKPLNNNLDIYAEDAHALVMKHIPKANSIEEVRIDNEIANIHGVVYDIKGVGAASPYQFYITDSTKHFMRGALYFNALPNNDSLAPVIEFLKQDIMHILETTTWK